MRCSVVLILVALASCASLGRAQLQIDETAFFDAFKAKHPVAWSEGSAGGAGIALGSPRVRAKRRLDLGSNK